MNNFLHIKKHKDNSEQNSLPLGYSIFKIKEYILIAENIQSIGLLLNKRNKILSEREIEAEIQ